MRRRGGFTLVEVMLVVVILAITTAMAIPRFAASFKGARLRQSARTIVTAHRYARSTAVLKQWQMALIFDRVKGEILLVSLGPGFGRRSGFLDGFRDQQAAGDEAVTVETVLQRTLEPDVRISRFDMAASDQEIDEMYFVNYFPNGMCDAFEVTLSDKRDKRTTISVDSISGRVDIDEDAF